VWSNLTSVPKTVTTDRPPSSVSTRARTSMSWLVIRRTVRNYFTLCYSEHRPRSLVCYCEVHVCVEGPFFVLANREAGDRSINYPTLVCAKAYRATVGMGALRSVAATWPNRLAMGRPEGPNVPDVDCAGPVQQHYVTLVRDCATPSARAHWSTSSTDRVLHPDVLRQRPRRAVAPLLPYFSSLFLFISLGRKPVAFSQSASRHWSEQWQARSRDRQRRELHPSFGTAPIVVSSSTAAASARVGRRRSAPRSRSD
jgi:hypothetical protein